MSEQLFLDKLGLGLFPFFGMSTYPERRGELSTPLDVVIPISHISRFNNHFETFPLKFVEADQSYIIYPLFALLRDSQPGTSFARYDVRIAVEQTIARVEITPALFGTGMSVSWLDFLSPYAYYVVNPPPWGLRLEHGKLQQSTCLTYQI